LNPRMFWKHRRLIWENRAALFRNTDIRIVMRNGLVLTFPFSSDFVSVEGGAIQVNGPDSSPLATIFSEEISAFLCSSKAELGLTRFDGHPG